MFKVSIIDHKDVIFDGKAKSVILPGDTGEFEILDFHHPIVSLLKDGNIIIDGTNFPIGRGIAKFHRAKLVILVEM